MAKDASASADQVVTTARMRVDWKYVVFFAMFYIVLIFIALFGMIAEA